MKLGKKLKAIRQTKGYTQEGLAFEAGFSIATYGRIERDETDVKISDLERIGKVLEVSIIEIITFGSSYQSELEKLKKIVGVKDKEIREKDKEIITLQKKLLKKNKA